VTHAQETSWEIDRGAAADHPDPDKIDPWLIAMQAMIEQSSKTFPFSVALSLAATPTPFAHRTERYSLETTVGIRLRSPSDGFPDQIARRLVLIGPLFVAELGSRVGIALTETVGLYGRGAVRAGIDATRLDPEQVGLEESETIEAAVVGSQLAAGLAVDFLQLGVGLERYRVMTESELSVYSDESDGRLYPTATAIASLPHFHLFFRSLLGGSHIIRGDAWSAGIGATLYP
jgi:hypothetical protein